MNANKLIASAAVAAGLAIATGAHASAIVSDGDFSNPSGGTSFTTYSGGSSIGAWTVTGDSVDLIGGYWTAPTVGGGSVDLDGNAPGGLTQDLGVLKAGAYDLTFYVSGNPDGAPNPKVLDVNVGGVSQTYDPASGVSHSDMNYQLETLKFFSNGVAATTLAFTSGDVGTPYGPVIGGVSVAAVPEPATWAMMLVGFGGIGAAMRTARRNKGAAAVAA